MFCPQCGQERVSVETNYCSRCGFLLTAAANLLQTGGRDPLEVSRTTPQPISPRRRGIKQGLFIFLLTFLVVPIVAMLSVMLRIDPVAAGVASVFFFMGGVLRMVYALMFESVEPGAPTLEEKIIAGAATFNAKQDQKALAPDRSDSATSYVSPATGNWRDTNDLQPRSVVEGTTKLLELDERNQ